MSSSPGTGHVLRAGAALRAFAGDDKGATAMIFAAAFVPLMIASGVAVDLARLNEQKSNLQQSADFVALSLAKDVQNDPNARPTATTGARYLAAVNKDTSATLAPNYPTFDATSGEVCVKARTNVPTVIMSLAGIANMPTSATSCANVAAGTYEVALVLDNTGSMASSVPGGTKMSALQAAARDFVNYMFNSTALGPRTKMSLVPFAASVNIGTTYASASFMDTTGQSSWTWKSPAFAPDSTIASSRFDLFRYLTAIRSSFAWGGCVESLPYPYNITDTPGPDPSSNLFVPLLAPDEPDADYIVTYYDNRGRLRTDTVNNPFNYTNTYLDDNGACPGADPAGSSYADELTKQSRLCKYKNGTLERLSSSFSPNMPCTTTPLLRMQSSSSSLLTKIDSMAANGNTNIHEGLIWGWRTISPNAPFADGKAYTDERNIKVIVVMTDGENTWNAASNQINKSAYSAYGYFTNANGRLPPTNQNITTETGARAAMDALTLQTCSNARAAGVVIYAIGFSGTYDPIDQAGRDLLSACAGRSDRVFFTNTSGGLQSAFAEIGNQIGKLRLTK